MLPVNEDENVARRAAAALHRSSDRGSESVDLFVETRPLHDGDITIDLLERFERVFRAVGRVRDEFVGHGEDSARAPPAHGDCDLLDVLALQECQDPLRVRTPEAATRPPAAARDAEPPALREETEKAPPEDAEA